MVVESDRTFDDETVNVIEVDGRAVRGEKEITATKEKPEEWKSELNGM